MHDNKKDRELKEHFEALRNKSVPLVPSFEKIWLKARRQKRRKKYRQLISIAAAALIVLLSWFYFLQIKPKPSTADLVSSTILQWQAPTDEVLPTTATSISNWKAATDILLKNKDLNNNLPKITDE